FTQSTSSLVCSALWFIGLGLSLTCTRAGMKHFSIYTVLDVISLFLHASLVFFFAGLVAFRLPNNLPMASLAAAILVAVVAIYLLLTLRPLLHLDYLYRIPLSTAFWRFSRIFMMLWRRQHATVDS
ncbi:hypothetical protein B0H19DRAFT_926274, partial [Mycena capillaripes]